MGKETKKMRMTMKHVFRFAGASRSLLLAVAMLFVAAMVFTSTALGQDDPQCIDGIPDRDGDGQISSIEAAQAGADATQGGGCSGADAQYGEDEESTAGAEETTVFTGECAGAIEQLAADQPNVSEEVFQSYYSYLPDVGGCVSFEGNTFISSLSVPVYDSETGEELGIVKDLDPDLTSGEFSVTYAEFCGAFIPQIQTAQDYFDQDANAQEQAILDPNSDGSACTDEDGAFLSGDGESQSSDVPCSDFLGYSAGYWGYFSDAGGCVLLEGTWPVVGVLNVSVQDPDTRQEIGLIKDLDPDLTSGDFSVTYEEFCGAFPTPEYAGPSVISGFTAQEYFEQEANDKERAILDPNGDGLACTDGDEDFLAGETGGGDETQFEETWSGFITGFDDEDNPVGGYELEIEIMPVSEMTEDMIGEVVGRSTLSLGCTGIYYLEEVNEDSVRVEAPVETGFENCVDGIHVLTPQADGTLEHYTPGGSNISTSRGILTREGSLAPYEVQLPLGDIWTGPLTQTMQDGTTLDFDLEVELLPISEMTEGLVGQIIGKTIQEGIECNGVWLLEEVGEDSIVVEERITSGADDCVETTRITLTLQDDESLEYYFLDSYGSTGEGVLTLQQSNPPEYEMEEIGVPADTGEPSLPSEIWLQRGVKELPNTGGPTHHSQPLPAAGIWE